jgi:hypothetical protein
MGKMNRAEMARDVLVRVARSNADNVKLTKENSQEVSNKLTNTLEN